MNDPDTFDHDDGVPAPSEEASPDSGGLLQELHGALAEQVGRCIVGQQEAIRLLFISLVAGGHVLIEGVPGLAKTTLARSLAESLALSFGRVQFTPDLMPSDILGTQVFDFQKGSFHLVEGPVFTQVLLADEINRAPAKTQAALLEAMQEGTISLDGKPRRLPQPFLVLATQNPIEHEGTYPLPEAQLDRFLFKVVLDYPEIEEEIRILEMHRGDAEGLRESLGEIQAVTAAEDLLRAREEAFATRLEPGLRRYLIELIRATRDHESILHGASPRAALLLQLAARIAARLEGRDYVIPDDIKGLLLPLLRHRIFLTATAEVEGADLDEVIREVADGIPVPR